LTASLFKKGLSENPATFEFKELIPESYRRDQPAQRLCHNPFQKRLERKNPSNDVVDVIKRLNGWGSTAEAQRLQVNGCDKNLSKKAWAKKSCRRGQARRRLWL